MIRCVLIIWFKPQTFPHKLCWAVLCPSLSQSTANSSMCSSMGLTLVWACFVTAVLQPGLLRGWNCQILQSIFYLFTPFRVWELLSGRGCHCKNSAVAFTPTCEFLLEGAEYWQFLELMAQVGYKIHNHRRCLSSMHVSSSVSLEDHHGPVWNEKNSLTAWY